MTITYPRCPRCDRRAAHRPLVVEEGACRILVQHTHDRLGTDVECEVNRYAARVDEDGEQDNRPLPDGVDFERAAV